MPSQELLSLSSPDNSNDAHGLLDTQRHRVTRSTEHSEAPSLDTETFTDGLYIAGSGAAVASDVTRVDAGRLPTIHNAFWVAGKVPSLNDLLQAKGTRQPVVRSIIMRAKPQKRQRGGEYDLYNDIKQDWKARTVRAVPNEFTKCNEAYFGYLIVEETLRRDPSNFCSAAVKFIEDGLIKAGVIPNDGWDNVLGIRVHWVHHRNRDPGVYVIMSDVMVPEALLVAEYEKYHLMPI